MIGSIDVSGTTATLSDRGVWRCADPALAGLLNRMFSPLDDGPADGLFGRGQVVRAARRLGAAHWLAPEPPPEPDEFGPGVVY